MSLVSGIQKWPASIDWTGDLIDERNKVKQVCEREPPGQVLDAVDMRYRLIDQIVTRSCRWDKRDWIGQKGQEAQEAANKNDTKTLYRIVQELSGAPSGRGVPVKRKDGRFLTTAEEQDQRWVQHFEEILNQPAPMSTTRLPPRG